MTQVGKLSQLYKLTTALIDRKTIPAISWHGPNDYTEEVASVNTFFSINEIKALQRLPLNKNEDRTYILQALKYAYKDNPADSMTISKDGEVEVLPGKDPLSPVKILQIKELFIERLSKCDMDSVGYSERIKESKINEFLALIRHKKY